MKCRWSIIPDLNEIEAFIKLSEKYDAAFEYNDFFYPDVYQNGNELERRVECYLKLDRDRSEDTLHGVFYDIAMLSTDDVIRSRSRELADMSMSVAQRLGCRGVVFHTGMIAGLSTQSYTDRWVSGMCGYMSELAAKYPDISIYMENTFEKDPGALLSFAQGMKDHPNIGLCLDYAHARLTSAPPEEWFKRMGSNIRHMHLNDHDLKADLHLAAGDGSIDFNEFKALMEKYDPDTRVLLEVSGYDKAARSLEYMDRL